MNNVQLSNILHIQEASKQGKLVMFVGAGVSANSGVPMWSELIQGLKKELPDSLKNETDDLKIAQLYKDSRGYKEYIEKIKELLLHGKIAPNPIHDAILELAPCHIITTNYDDLKSLISKNIEEFNLSSGDNLKKILEYSCNELSAYTDIFLFDYSSTVEKAISYLSDKSDSNINVYISESSAIDGGSPFLKLNNKDNLKIHFFPDSAALHFLKKSQCCLMGAETFYPNGTGFNTIGSDIMGYLCKKFDIKLYFITPMNKLDERRNLGIRKESVYIDYKEKYKNSNLLDDSVFTSIPELIGVEPDNIFAYITEFGVIPTNSMYLLSKEYISRLGGKHE